MSIKKAIYLIRKDLTEHLVQSDFLSALLRLQQFQPRNPMVIQKQEKIYEVIMSGKNIIQLTWESPVEAAT